MSKNAHVGNWLRLHHAPLILVTASSQRHLCQRLFIKSINWTDLFDCATLNLKEILKLFERLENYIMYHQLFVFMIVCCLAIHSHAQPVLFFDSNPLLLTSEPSNNIIDILTRDVLNRMGYDVKISMLPLERALNNLNQGIDDGMILCRNSKLDSYTNLRQVPEKIIDLQVTAFTNSGNLNIQNWSDLNNHNVGILSGIKPIEQSLAGHARLVKVKEPAQLFQLLKDKRVDYAIFTYWNGMEYVHSLGLQNRIKPIDQPLINYPMYMYVNKKHEALIPQLVQSLRTIKEEGRYQRMFDEQLAKFFPAEEN